MKNQSIDVIGNLRKINDVLCKFDHYLDLERGLAQSTKKKYCAYVYLFLSFEFKTKKFKIKDLSSEDVFRFILFYSQENGSSSTQYMIYSLRNFFRFLGLFELADCLPSIPQRQYSIPEFLSKIQLTTLLEGCDQNNSIGIRDYAILMLLIHLGLRRSEVSKLVLSDFNWDKSEITIRGKGSISRFPISKELGDALVKYLKCARPICPCNSFFVRIYQPFRGLNSTSISKIVSSGLQRAGLNPLHKGAHLLRHSFATQLLAKGKSLHEISMVLRHKNIRTTAIYAHVDFNKLRSVSLPWPVILKEENHE
jgi:site-specific recombinase XerD